MRHGTRQCWTALPPCDHPSLPPGQVEHKIQSSEGPLNLSLQKVGARRWVDPRCTAAAAAAATAAAAAAAAAGRDGHGGSNACWCFCLQVPKMLALLRHRWAPEAFAVSFKLETDESILISKVHSPCLFAPAQCTSSVH